MNDPDFFNMDRDRDAEIARKKRLGDEAKKAFEDCFDTSAGRRTLEILKSLLGGECGELVGTTDPIEIAREDTKRRVYWFIATMARKANEREVIH